MEHISLKLEDSIARQVEQSMKEFNYTTKTEFIRDAIRGKLKELKAEQDKEKAWQALFAARGVFKGREKFKTDEEWHNWRSNEGSKELMEYFEKKMGTNQK